MDIDPVSEMSPLCQSLTWNRHTVQIEIHADDSGKWILEVVDHFGTSTIWDDQFDSDQEALDEVHRTVKEEGIKSLVGPASDHVH